MTVHFAASRLNADSPIARVLRRRAPATAANDNCHERADDRLLHAALRHFAQYGIGAAHEARGQAERAFFAGDRERYDWWLGICRTLDARLARSIEQAEGDRAGPRAGAPLRPASDA
ncbi:hypothetical protein [Pelagerythrobacter sp.]|uniref:hypothetical protein n=1 Tax=Pelagerythrobacter sp. TaxID=2800702 RepID=UPI0035B32A53